MPLPTTFTGWSSLSMIASPHLLQMRLVRWLSSSRFASEARAVFESSPFLGIDVRPLSPIFLLYCCFLYLDFLRYWGTWQWATQYMVLPLRLLQYITWWGMCPCSFLDIFKARW